jgi:hypothetical protein
LARLQTVPELHFAGFGETYLLVPALECLSIQTKFVRRAAEYPPFASTTQAEPTGQSQSLVEHQAQLYPPQVSSTKNHLRFLFCDNAECRRSLFRVRLAWKSLILVHSRFWKITLRCTRLLSLAYASWNAAGTFTVGAGTQSLDCVGITRLRAHCAGTNRGSFLDATRLQRQLLAATRSAAGLFTLWLFSCIILALQRSLNVLEKRFDDWSALTRDDKSISIGGKSKAARLSCCPQASTK